MVPMEQGVEWFVAVTAFVIGLSHMLRPGDWSSVLKRLYELGRPAAFVNGALSLITSAVILGGHRTWEFPGVVITLLGCLLFVKSVVCFLAPDLALRSMLRGANSPRSFVIAGTALLAICAWASFCLIR